MHPDNGFYGHRAVLLAAAGVERPIPVAAHVQHGWQLGTGLNERGRLVRGLRKLVWGRSHEERAAEVGITNVRAIGAPFAYLVRGLEPTRSTTGTMYFPFHGWTRARAEGSHEALARAIVEREEGPVTVCLYHLDHERSNVRSAYEQHGFRVFTAGPRDDNPDFLPRLRDELLRHRRVASNHMGTAVLYGALLGLSAEIYGPVFEMHGLVGDIHDRHRSAFPRWYADGGVGPEEARGTATRELGAGLLLSPEELRDELGAVLSPLMRRALQVRVMAEHHVRRAVAQVRR